MKITIKQLKQLIKEQVEESRGQQFAHKTMEELVNILIQTAISASKGSGNISEQNDAKRELLARIKRLKEDRAELASHEDERRRAVNLGFLAAGEPRSRR